MCVTSCLWRSSSIEPFTFTGGPTFSCNIYHNMFMLEYYSVSFILWKMWPTEGAAPAPPTPHLSVKDAPPCFVDRSNQPVASHCGGMKRSAAASGAAGGTLRDLLSDLPLSAGKLFLSSEIGLNFCFSSKTTETKCLKCPIKSGSELSSLRQMFSK